MYSSIQNQCICKVNHIYSILLKHLYNPETCEEIEKTGIRSQITALLLVLRKCFGKMVPQSVKNFLFICKVVN